jgi:DivIVA domain-containing protein
VADDPPNDRPAGRAAGPAADGPLVTNLSSHAHSRMHPADVARHAFTTVRRGFDAEEVRAFLGLVAQQLDGSERREQELLHELTNAEERARHPVIDEGVLSSALGQHSAAILRAAHDEAARIVQQAEDAAATLLRDAQQHATDCQVNAESSAAERIAEAELEANGLRQQAREEAGAIVSAARSEGEALIERARDHGRAMLDQAQEARRRVLADTAQRRRVVTDQIEQFRAARDEVAGSVIGVRRSLDRIVEDLSRADDAARAAASEAARPVRAAASESTLVEEAERAAAEVGADSGEALAHLAATGDALVQSAVPQTATRDEWAAVDPLEGAGAVHGEGSGGIGEETDAGPAGEGAASERVMLHFDDVAAVAAGPGSGGPGDAAGPVRGPAPEEQDVRELERAATPEPTAADVATPSTDVDHLFARLRARGDLDPAPGAPAAGTAGTGGAAAADAPAAAEGGPPAPPTVEEAGSTVPEGAGADTGEPPDAERDTGELSPDAAALVRRAGAIDPVVGTLARKLKRALQDDQNRLLDRLRQGTGEWSDALLADEPSQKSAYASAASGPVKELVAAGIGFARSQARGRQGRAPSPDQRTVDKIAEELSATVVTLLRRRLEGGDIPDAAERIGAAYREWRGERIERLAEDAAVDAFDAGVLAGAGKGRAVRWVRSDDGPGCADCEDNALAGAVKPGDAFPTGHSHPPAHAGCRCLLLPTPV